eukprot:CAMPEP_0118918206 /NCGR_PEP_ID=MMETSP1166-20130328/17761_1 /TAXON_ID=1104430 /ORGANISM="Chrysoreinhardia sp, Strain CCMP3193" /LENGTH=59 /DNA_ID=CAMNT_0006858453 /DNA_START=245 /DNA_END=422 /DNA_ORIENTATION=-
MKLSGSSEKAPGKKGAAVRAGSLLLSFFRRWRGLGFEEVHLDVAQVLRVAQFAAVVFPV